MAKKTFDNLAKSEIRAIEKQIRQTVIKMNELADEHDRLGKSHYKLTEELTEAKKQATQLKKFIWTSDNPNIVELRNEILLAAKLIKDNP